MSTEKYEVFGMRLLPQRLDMACWYASARMLLNWRESQSRQQSLMKVPELDAESKKLREANNGIINPQILKLAKRLGLKAVPPQTPTPHAIGLWLRSYGPLWVNGRNHIVVIAGIDRNKVKVYDPWPLNVGKVDWRPLDSWYYNGASPSSPDTSASVRAVFLHC
ncbi:papain-like cysteine protease family protein [Marinobacter sp. chi1]|uniref:Papain-like cysteine protease family protein n=1 Tax=Marinobacter suaedae TaxID=3057675 RepID=A0ABT8VW44_9GAMM|nr:papain-like cysteine protease family protein [Marinobacter sp. chi1]MDO3720165.1 papain-like cysteine protease family protein [Marinobacter sp. chi1]